MKKRHYLVDGCILLYSVTLLCLSYLIQYFKLFSTGSVFMHSHFAGYFNAMHI